MTDKHQQKSYIASSVRLSWEMYRIKELITEASSPEIVALFNELEVSLWKTMKTVRESLGCSWTDEKGR